ncbi:hypothetical protein Tco_0329173 [Tanacetum coccineum]
MDPDWSIVPKGHLLTGNIDQGNVPYLKKGLPKIGELVVQQVINRPQNRQERRTIQLYGKTSSAMRLGVEIVRFRQHMVLVELEFGKLELEKVRELINLGWSRRLGVGFFLSRINALTISLSSATSGGTAGREGQEFVNEFRKQDHPMIRIDEGALFQAKFWAASLGGFGGSTELSRLVVLVDALRALTNELITNAHDP